MSTKKTGLVAEPTKRPDILFKMFKSIFILCIFNDLYKRVFNQIQIENRVIQDMGDNNDYDAT